MNPRQKEIYLVPFPFSDFSKRKVRPVLILSNNNYNKISSDLIICAITSNFSNNNLIDLIPEDLESGKLLMNSKIKSENICFIDKSLLIKQIAKIKNSKYLEVKKEILNLIR